MGTGRRKRENMYMCTMLYVRLVVARSFRLEIHLEFIIPMDKKGKSIGVYVNFGSSGRMEPEIKINSDPPTQSAL